MTQMTLMKNSREQQVVGTEGGDGTMICSSYYL